MWAQDWLNLADILVPFKSKSSVDVTQEMVAQVRTLPQTVHGHGHFMGIGERKEGRTSQLEIIQ